MHRLLLATLALPALSACQQPECVSNRDCGIGNICSIDSSCRSGVRATSVGTVRGTPADVDVDAVLSQGAGPGEFDGNIGLTSSTGTAETTWFTMESGIEIITVTLPQQPNTFVVLTFADATVLEQPGQVVVADPASTEWTGSWARACNYDADAYDEPLNDVVVDVPPPDAAGIVAMSVRLKGTGSEGAAVLSWTPPAAR